MPSDSFGNTVITELNTCWGSLDKNNTNNNQSQFSTIDSPQLKIRNKNNSNRVIDDLNNHDELVTKKRNLIKFYEKKAAELVADTVDTAANRCRMHLLWQIFSTPIEQQVSIYQEMFYYLFMLNILKLKQNLYFFRKLDLLVLRLMSLENLLINLEWSSHYLNMIRI